METRGVVEGIVHLLGMENTEPLPVFDQQITAILSTPNGLELRFKDGSEFQVNVVKTKAKRSLHTRCRECQGMMYVFADNPDVVYCGCPAHQP